MLVSFKYIHGDSLIHRLDVRTKLFMVFAYLVMALSLLDMRVLAILFVSSAMLWPLAKTPMKEVGKLLIPMLIFIAFFSFATNAFYPGIAGKPYHIVYQWGWIKISLEALIYSATVALRYLAIFPAATVFIMTTHPTKMAVALAKLKIPYKLAYVMNIALRYLPTLALDYEIIKNAQRARGFEMDRPQGGLVGRLKAALPVMIPMVMDSINRAELIADAMDLRCFGVYKDRTWYHDLKFTKTDYIVCTILLIGVITCILLRLFVLKRLWVPV